MFAAEGPTPSMQHVLQLLQCLQHRPAQAAEVQAGGPAGGCSRGEMIDNYLTGRPQFVSLQNCVSGHLISKLGVPQGTVLSPFLFTTFRHIHTFNMKQIQYLNKLCQIYSLDHFICPFFYSRVHPFTHASYSWPVS